MFSITSYPCHNTYSLRKNNVKPLYVKSFCAVDVTDILSKGDKALNENKFEEALKYYLEAKNKNPEENQVYRKIGKTNSGLKNYVAAEQNFQKYLSKVPESAEAWIELGESQRKQGLYQKALESFTRAAELDPKNDLANRSILETKNNILAIHSPERAKAEKQAYAAKNLRAALDMTVEFMTPEYMQGLENVTIEFGDTAQMGGTTNIAQYENYKSKITVSNQYTYAAPQVIAAYLAHESVHAHDNDPYTSVREEQDAYQVATKFWMNYSNGVKDPEMDYALDLYEQSPTVLNDRVAEIYRLRDPNISETSPNHPKKKLFHITSTKKKVASHSLKTYNVIA